MELSSFNYRNYDKTKRIVIYGATVGAKVIFYALKNLNIQPSFFVDKNPKLFSQIDNVPVCDISCISRNDIVINALTRSFSSACDSLYKLDLESVYECVSIIEAFDLRMCHLSPDEVEIAKDFKNKYPIYATKQKNDTVVLPSLELFITQRCTLKCRDCSHLIPLYEKPKDIDVEEIIRDMEQIFSAVERIEDLIILGGEPFLYKDLRILLDYLYQKNQIGIITFITNGTIIPNDEVLEAIMRVHARVRISNYGIYARNKDKLIDKCREFSISCYVNDEDWLDMGTIVKHNYSIDYMQDMFKNCPFVYALLLYNGELFRCAHIAHLNKLGFINTRDYDAVNIRDKENDLRDAIINLMNISYLEGCRYCNGIGDGTHFIKPAIQGIKKVEIN